MELKSQLICTKGLISETSVREKLNQSIDQCDTICHGVQLMQRNNEQEVSQMKRQIRNSQSLLRMFALSLCLIILLCLCLLWGISDWFTSSYNNCLCMMRNVQVKFRDRCVDVLVLIHAD